MKPKIDTNSLIFKIAQAAFNKEVKSALEIEMKVEKAVIPISAIPRTKKHRNPKKKPEQIGSGVLVNIKDQYFVFSSTHVFTEFEGKSFFTLCTCIAHISMFNIFFNISVTSWNTLD